MSLTYRRLADGSVSGNGNRAASRVIGGPAVIPVVIQFVIRCGWFIVIVTISPVLVLCSFVMPNGLFVRIPWRLV